MSPFVEQMALHARHQIQRHLRSPAIWLLAIAGPLAARYLVPEPDASYSLIGVNDGRLELSASVIGLQLGVLTAVLLAPLAYIFLRAGPTRTQPRQVTDALPRSRPALSLGQWIGDVAALWFLLLILALAGVVVSLFRLPLEDVAPHETLMAALIVASPALALIAAVRTLFAMRPALRKGWGDALFVVVWIGALTLSAAFFMDGSGGSPFVDIFGFAAPFVTGTSEPVTALYIGGAPGAGARQITFDAMSGVTEPAYLLSRLVWLIAAAMIALGAGALFSAGRPKRTKARPEGADGPASFGTDTVRPVHPSSAGLLTRLTVWMDGAVRPRWLWLPIMAIAVAGFVLPLRGMIGPALMLLLIFPLARYGARWRPQSVGQWMQSFPMTSPDYVGGRLLTVITVCAVLMVPSVMSLQPGEWRDVLFIAIGVPTLAVALGYVTRGPVAARLVLLILWYGYLNLGPVA